MEDAAKQAAVIEKVRKLLALAAGNANENEAALAAEKAQDLLEAYNLDIATINKVSNTFSPRDQQKRGGGLYKWQRGLWHAVSTLNFCTYRYYQGNRANTEYQHELIGSKANVIGAELMAKYLEDTVERLARQWVKENRPGKSVFIREAIAYREGVANRLANRLWHIRWERMDQEKERIKRERAENLRRGINTENALVLQDVTNTEEDLNTDHINGWEPGTAAKRRIENEARQAAAEAAAAELLRKQAEWDKAHPEEAKARAAKDEEAKREFWDKWDKKARKKAETPEEKRRKLGSYVEGWHKGADVSLDKQIKDDKAHRIR